METMKHNVLLFNVYADPNGTLWTITKFWYDKTIGIENTETTEKKSITLEELLSNYKLTEL